jgi:hypothetical protein
MKRSLAATGLVVCLLSLGAGPAAATHLQSKRAITLTVTGSCYVDQTLTIHKMNKRVVGGTVSMEFLPGVGTSGDPSYSTFPVESLEQNTFSLPRQFVSSENGGWVAHAQLFYSTGGFASESYVSFAVTC